MGVKIFFVPQGARHLEPSHSEIPGFLERHALTRETPYKAVGDAFVVTDLGYDEADEYHPYRLDTPDMAQAQTFLEAELPFHDGIAILRHPRKYNARKDTFLTQDAELATEMAQVGFAALAVGPGQGAALQNVLRGVPVPDGVENPEDEMFAEGGEITSTMRDVPVELLLPKAEPFPVVLGRTAIAAGWGADGTELSAIDIMDHLTALMGGQAYEVQREEGEVIGGIYESAGFAIEFSADQPPEADLGHDGPVIYFDQTFDAIPDDADILDGQSVDQGLRDVAARIGICLAIEVPYDAAAGWLVGYRREPSGALEDVRVWYDAEAAEDADD